MPNSFAYLMLLVWPLAALGLFARLPPERALVWSILGAYLLLPPLAAFDFPLVPPLDKVAIPNLCALALCLAVVGRKAGFLPRSNLSRLLLVLFIGSPVVTTLANPDPILFANGAIPGMRTYDAIAAASLQVIAIIPFLLGRQLLVSHEAHRDVLVALVLGALAYSLPMLVEIRLSPQINVWVYGFFQHDFIQMMRNGGFRPLVFLPHGLWAALFVFAALIASASLWCHERGNLRALWMLAAGYLSVLLVLCKSMASLLYAAAILPLLVLLPKGQQLRLAAALVAVALLYPLLRGADLVPTEAIIAQAEQVSSERAKSLEYRLDNEDALLARAWQRPFFGWGSWGRNQILDPVTGEIVSVTDGRWIIVMGTYGWLGYLAEFGLLALPTLSLLRSARKNPTMLSPFAATLALIHGANMFDLLPNATLIPLTWLTAGALAGHAEAVRSQTGGAAALPREALPDVEGRPRTVL